jgi:hypothetical protein
MLLPLSRAWSPLQKLLIVAGVVLGLFGFGTLIYVFERHYGLPSDQVLVGTWEHRYFDPDWPIYYQLNPDHNLRVFVGDSDVLATGRWYAGGNFVFFRWSIVDEPEVTHGLIWRIDEILPNEIHIHKNPGGMAFTLPRVNLPARAKPSGR